MKAQVFSSDDRGKADFGWLKANYSFSFNNYHNPDKIRFGKLRVLNDDVIEGGKGFSTHGHENMEIISIVLKGALAHEDSTGSKGVIRPGEVQIMSAGSGITHSEKNYIKNGETSLLQIWIFPKEQNITPVYGQQYFDEKNRVNRWEPVVSNLHPSTLNINQDAVLSLAKLEKGNSLTYTLNYENNGVFLFVIEGEINLENEIQLKTRDAVGIENENTFAIKAKIDSKLLAIEVPMN